MCAALHASRREFRMDIDKGQRDKSSFLLHHALYRLINGPLGMEDGFVTIQKAQDVMLASMCRELARVYLHDIVVISKALHNHIARAGHVQRLSYKTGTSFKPNKSRLSTDTVNFLGQFI